MSDKRKLTGVAISAGVVERILFREGSYIGTGGFLPDGREFSHVYYDNLTDRIVFVFKHESLRELSEGECIPVLNTFSFDWD